MGIYSNMTNNHAILQELEEVEAQVFPDSMDILECTFQSITEAEDNWNTFMKAVGLNELNCLVTTNEEYIYEAGGAASFLETAKQWFMKLFQKIKGIFEKFMAKISSFVSSDSKFVSKYEDKIREGSSKIPASTSFSGYTFEKLKNWKLSNFGPDKAISEQEARQIIKSLQINLSGSYKNSNGGVTKNNDADFSKSLEKFKEDDKNALNEIRGAMCGSTSKIESAEFSKELRDYLYGDKEALDDSYLSHYSEFINEIKDAKKCKEDAKADFNNLKEIINDAIKKTEDYKTELKGDDNENNKVLNERKIKVIDALIASYKECLTMYTTANGIHLAALKDYNRQCKAICVKLVGFASRQSAENASAIYQTEQPAFGAIDFI